MTEAKKEKTPKRPAKRTGDRATNTRKKTTRLLGASPDLNEENVSMYSEEPIVKPINVNVGILRRSKQHAKSLGIKSMKEYAENALLYFVKNGMNPCEQIHAEELSKEMVRLRNHIFAFMQKQEQQYIVPMFKEVFEHGKSFEQTQRSLEQLVGQLQQVYVLLYKIHSLSSASLSTMLHISDLPEEEVNDIQAENSKFVEDQMKDLLGKMQGQ